MLGTLVAHAAPDRTRPNFILIMVDDMGYSDIGCYGGEVKTPNLDKLAKNGLRFTQFYNTAKCHTTRAELLTAAHNDTFLSADFVPDKASKSAKGNLCFYF